MDPVILTPETKDKIELALNLMGTYIGYVKRHDNCLHFQANGTPSCELALKEATQAFFYDTTHGT